MWSTHFERFTHTQMSVFSNGHCHIVNQDLLCSDNYHADVWMLDIRSLYAPFNWPTIETIKNGLEGAPGQWISIPSLRPLQACLWVSKRSCDLSERGPVWLGDLFFRWCIIITIQNIQNESVMMNSRIWGILINCRALKGLGSRFGH